MGTFTTSASGTTFHTAMAVARHFDAFRVVLANGATGGAIPISSCAVSMIADGSTDSKLNNSSGTWLAATFDGGSASGSIPAAPAAGRRGFKVSDLMSVANSSSVGRTDGGTLPLLGIRHYISASSTAYTVIGNGSDSYAGWKTIADGRIWVSRKHDGDAVGTPANLANTTDIHQTTIAGIIYYARGQVVGIAATGDSVQFGYGASVKGAGWLHGVVAAQHSDTGLAVDEINLGWTGQASDDYVLAVSDLIAAGYTPDICFVPGGTQNDLGGATIAAGNIAKYRRTLLRMCADAFAAGCIPVVSTMPPTNSKAYNATDSLRRAHNADLLQWTARGIPIADFATPLEGADNGQGQLVLQAALTGDGTHPNDAGNALMAANAIAAIAYLVA